MKGEVLFLGTGGSAGIPMIGCRCAVCTSENPKNKRMRPSALITVGDKKLLVDTGPDLRFQALDFGVSVVDGVLITHTHFDHIGGLDELRTFYLLSKKVVPVLLSRNSYNDIQKRMPYLFRERTKGGSLTAQLEFQIIEDERGVCPFLDIPIQYMTYEQGGMPVNGFRIGNLAYISDIRNYPESIFEDLQGVEVLILSALRPDISPMHFTIAEASDFAEKVSPKKCYFMHISHEVDHDIVNAALPLGIELAYDGLKISYG